MGLRLSDKSKQIGLLRPGLTLLSVACHTVSAGRHLLEFGIARADGEYLTQVILLLSISFLASVAGIWVLKGSSQLLVFAMQFGAVILAGYPSGIHIGHDGVLFVSTVVTVVAMTRRPFSFVVPGVFLVSYILVILLSDTPAAISAWYTRFNAVTTAVVSVAIVIVFVETLRGMRASFSESNKRNERLNKTVFRLMDMNLRFQDQASELSEQSVTNERLRISREVHDTVGYSTTNIMMMMQAAAELAPKNATKLQDLLGQARTQAKEGYEEARRALYQLRAGDAKSEMGSRTIEKMIARFREVTGMRIRVEYGNMPSTLGDSLDHLLYKLVQEGLTNVFRHGRATEVLILFWLSQDELSIVIHDDGIGSSQLTEGIGFRGIRERLQPFHGSMRAGNVSNGFELQARIPIESKASGDE